MPDWPRHPAWFSDANSVSLPRPGASRYHDGVPFGKIART